MKANFSKEIMTELVNYINHEVYKYGFVIDPITPEEIVSFGCMDNWQFRITFEPHADKMTDDFGHQNVISAVNMSIVEFTNIINRCNQMAMNNLRSKLLNL